MWRSAAIAICAALVATDLTDGLMVAVNHSGDSDSTGSIAGNILGTLLGEQAIRPDFLDELELRAVITELADDFAEAFYGGGVGGAYQPWDAHTERMWTRYPGC